MQLSIIWVAVCVHVWREDVYLSCCRLRGTHILFDSVTQCDHRFRWGRQPHGSFFLHLPWLELHATILFTWCLSIEFRSSCLDGKLFLVWIISHPSCLRSFLDCILLWRYAWWPKPTWKVNGLFQLTCPCKGLMLRETVVETHLIHGL